MTDRNIFISIGAGENQLPLLEAAQILGYNILAIDKNAHAVGINQCNHFIESSILDKQFIWQQLQKQQFTNRIIGIGCRSYAGAVVTAEYLAERLSLPGFGAKIASAFLNKKFQKQIFSSYGIRVAQEYKKTDNIPLPCILKPTIGSGKKGIQIIESKPQLAKAITSDNNFDRNFILEELIVGEEVTLMGFIDKKFHPLAVIDKITTNEPPFLEIAHRLPSQQYKFFGELNLIANQIVKATNLQNCPLVAEFKITADGEIILIEAVPEIGGEYLAEKLLPAFGYRNYFKDYINLKTGSFIPSEPIRSNDNSDKAQILFMVANDRRQKLINYQPPTTLACDEIFFEKTFKKPGDILDRKQGNAARIYAIGIQSTNPQETQEMMDERIRNSFHWEAKDV